MNRSVNKQPTVRTERLLLRPLTLKDAPELSRLAGRREIADTTISIPHPYSDEQARQWITGLADLCAQGKVVLFGMTLELGGSLVGTIGLRDIDVEHSQAELGFWVAVVSGRKRLISEAARDIEGSSEALSG